MNAYFLKQSVLPNSTIRKHKARVFFFLDPALLKVANVGGPHDNIIK